MQSFSSSQSTYPELKQHLFTPEGKLRSFVNVYLNDDDIRYLRRKEETAVKDTDELTIIPSIAGGTNVEPKTFPFVTIEVAYVT